MKFIKKLAIKLNLSQKIIIAIAVPLIIFFLSFFIFEEIENLSLIEDFNEDTILVFWVPFTLIIAYFNYHLFSNNK